jgi:predicted Zn finger-like uncharacterized protein
MIIECIKCNKKFEVNSDLIPQEGRTIQCGSCNHIWFYNKINQQNTNTDEVIKKDNSSDIIDKIIEKSYKSTQDIDDEDVLLNQNTQTKEKQKNTKKKAFKTKGNFSFSKFLSYIIVLIISFVGLIIILDTFKSPLYKIFPNLEFLLFSFFETLVDIKLFIKDLF